MSLQKKKPLKVALVAGEPSGDALGAGLMYALTQSQHTISFIGIGGEKMQTQGLVSLFDMHELSVMGLVEVLAHLPRLLAIRRQLIQTLIAEKPDVFIGIDAPDFNLGVEKKLKQAGIKTVHYVSPSVWAWRQNRIKTIKQAVDLVLSLLPFEKQFYDDHQVACTFVGHRLAEQISVTADISQQQAQKTLALAADKTWIAFLPGSRLSEIKRLAPVFIKACQLRFQCSQKSAFIVPLVNKFHVSVLKSIHMQIAPEIPIFYFVKETHSVIRAADVVVLASGTATLETMLLKKPMVVGYRLHALTYQFAKRLVKVPYIALPNLLANASVVPELIQEDCSPENIAYQIDRLLQGAGKQQITQFEQLHQAITRNADQHAAGAVLDLIQ